MATIEVTEFTDPGCAWSWSSEPKLRLLRHCYSGKVSWRRVFGVQIDDLKSSFPDRDAIDSVEEWRRDWLEVAGHTGAPITTRLDWMHTSTRPAANAAKAAESQGEAIADAVLRRLREAVFIEGRPADSVERIALALRGVADLDLGWLLDELKSRELADAMQKDFELTRRPHPDVIGLEEDGPHPGAAKAEGPVLRYSFPTLIVAGPAGERVVPGWRSLDEYKYAFEAAAPELRGTTSPLLDAETALRHYRSLSRDDLQLLTGTPEPPAAAVGVTTATAPLWLDPVEAERRATIAAATSLRR